MFINIFNLWLYLVLFFIVIPFLWEYFLLEHNKDYEKRFLVILTIVLMVTFYLDLIAIVNTIIKLFK
jgi:CDP-diglyceride synthetase